MDLISKIQRSEYLMSQMLLIRSIKISVLFIISKINILYSQKTIKLLHIAPERNLQKVFRVSKKINFISGDLNPLIADRKIDTTDIKFENNYFDFIICNHVLEHVKDDKKVMSELCRVLKKQWGSNFAGTHLEIQ